MSQTEGAKQASQGEEIDDLAAVYRRYKDHTEAYSRLRQHEFKLLTYPEFERRWSSLSPESRQHAFRRFSSDPQQLLEEGKAQVAAVIEECRHPEPTQEQ